MLDDSRVFLSTNRLFRSVLSGGDAVVPLETYTRSVLAVLQGQECQLFPFDPIAQQFRFVRVAVPELCTRLFSLRSSSSSFHSSSQCVIAHTVSTSQMMAECAEAGSALRRLDRLATTAQRFGTAPAANVFAHTLHHIVLRLQFAAPFSSLLLSSHTSTTAQK